MISDRTTALDGEEVLLRYNGEYGGFEVISCATKGILQLLGASIGFNICKLSGACYITNTDDYFLAKAELEARFPGIIIVGTTVAV